MLCNGQFNFCKNNLKNPIMHVLHVSLAESSAMFVSSGFRKFLKYVAEYFNHVTACRFKCDRLIENRFWSCPNNLYFQLKVFAWLFFTVMTQTLPGMEYELAKLKFYSHSSAETFCYFILFWLLIVKAVKRLWMRPSVNGMSVENR